MKEKGSHLLNVNNHHKNERDERLTKEMHKTLSDFKKRYNNQMMQQKEKYKVLTKQNEETDYYFSHHKSPS